MALDSDMITSETIRRPTMEGHMDIIELVERAQRGDRQCLNRLATLARDRLRVYVYRLTQQEDLTQEIVQESLLEMCRVLGKLKSTDRFWSWLYGIATNKLHRHYRTERTQRNAVAAEERRRGPMNERQAGLENLVSHELKQIISKAMQKLRTRHKAVLVMRCYDGMSYAEIADSMGCSEFSTRMLFVRAKKSLQKELSRNGFSKGSLLAALVIFGKMTAPSEAAAAQLTIPVAATKVGVLAGVAGWATTKTAVVSLTAAAAVTVGTVTTTSTLLSNNAGNRAAEPTRGARVVSPLGALSAQQKHWYYFPEGSQGPVMVRMDRGGTGSSPFVLQNGVANYSQRDGVVTINNHHLWQPDLSVTRLPTDSRTLSSFLSRVEGKTSDMQTVSLTRTSRRDLLVVLDRTNEADVGDSRPIVVPHDNVLEEGYFQDDWSAGIEKVDRRDAMHLRGWTYFRVRGSLGGKTVTGTGRIPFLYATSARYGAWLSLKVGDVLTMTDGDAGAIQLDAEGIPVARFPQGSLFQGLARPWMGLHTLDVVRRDAAERRAWFETRDLRNGRDVEVKIALDGLDLVYTIDMETDVVSTIEFTKAGASVGRLEFEYLQDIDSVQHEFIAPAGDRSGVTLQRSTGIAWLGRLASAALEN
ncbi:MAG: RNA polymerase sigma factor [Sedimentisphaerales bacterium]|nr:RNA polymerase sigma factor [Sedimentisphaerales bacterium]